MDLPGISIDIQSIRKTLGDKLIFEDFSLHIGQGEKWAILGRNGKGKSTLMKLICGMLAPDEGKIIFAPDSINKDSFNFYKYFSASAPWMHLDFALTVKECLNFLGYLKPFRKDVNIQIVAENGGLVPFLNVPMKGLSGGQMQRLKNALAFFHDTPLVLLDEPLSHLDSEGKNQYKSLFENFSQNRTVVVFSNHNAEETYLCTHQHEL
jgi:ABC-type multidrug transport system ATPase subunit